MGRASPSDTPKRRKGVEGAKVKPVLGTCFLILMLGTLPGIVKKADPRTHLTESHWEARAGAEPQHCKHAICSFGI